jgi:hypothetical protein
MTVLIFRIFSIEIFIQTPFFCPKGLPNICLTCIAYIGVKIAERSD